MIRTDRAHLHVAARSHPGMSGKQNEDRFAVLSFRRSERDPTPAVFAVVCDGIGGHRAGEVAAELAVEGIGRVVAESDGRRPLEVLAAAIQDVSTAIAAQAVPGGEREGMGATCACAWVIGDRLYTATVGDSRIYLIRGGRIRQLSVDHTWVQEAIDRGILTPDQARDHPNVHVIRRYLGSVVLPEPDFRLRLRPGESDAAARANQGLRLDPEDVLLLCSDGLSDLVSNEEILWAVRSAPTLEAAAEALIDLANQRGGHDNITVVLLSVPAGMPARRRTPRWLPWLIAGIVTGLILLSVVAALIWAALRPVGVKTPTPGPGPTLPTLTLPAPTRTPVPPTAAGPTPTPGPTYTPWPTNQP